MRLRQAQCLTNSLKSKSENWMAFHLAATGLRWIRQARWKGRIFDFWCREKGIAVEVDGPEHKHELDLQKDALAFKLAKIIVIRVKNMNEAEAQQALTGILNSSSWSKRKQG